MKQIICILLLTLTYSAYMPAQVVRNLEVLNKNQRNEYLIKKAKEVIDYLAPIYLRKKVKIEVEDSVYVYQDSYHEKKQFKVHIGHRYYKVKFVHSKPHFYSTEVCIEEDSGEPLFVYFSHHMGRHFMYGTFDDLKKEGLPKEKIYLTFPNDAFDE